MDKFDLNKTDQFHLQKYKNLYSKIEYFCLLIFTTHSEFLGIS